MSLVGFEETIFVTGFPGFIAGRLVEELAAEKTQVFLLVQNTFVQKAIEDIEEIAERTSVPLENFALIEGDLGEEQIGMSNEDYESIIHEVTDVFHLAAAYSLDVDKDLAYRVNLKGTENINNLVKKIKNLRRYNYVSTCYVAGEREDRIFETELEHGEAFRNYYEETKYHAEILVEELKADYPITIYRPAVVCGDSQTGETAKYDGIYYLMSFIQKFPEGFRLINVGNDAVRLNLVPVDFVVDAIVALRSDEKAEGKTVALADPSPMTTKEVCDSIAKAFTNKPSVITPPAKVVETFLNSPVSPALTGLPHSGVSYFFLPQTYDTSVANELLEPHHVACPPFSEYVNNLVEFKKKHPKL